HGDIVNKQLAISTRQLVVKWGAEERRQLPAIHIFERSLAGGVVAARKHHDLVIQAMALKLFHRLARKLWRERQIVFAIDNERFSRPAAKLAEIRYRADATPQLPQAFEVKSCLQAL